MTCERFADQTNGAGVDRIGKSSKRFAADGMRQPGVIAKLTDKCATCVVDVVIMVGSQSSVGPAIEFDRQRFVSRFEEGPIEMSRREHAQSPLNSGFCLLTNA